MAHTYAPPRRGRFEVLEQKNLLAGDVMVSVDNGRVTIEGDDEDNKVLITAGAEANAFIVTGLDGTTVTMNGSTSGEATLTGVRRISLDLGDGADLVAVAGADLRGNLSIDTGEGDDRVLIGTGGDATELAGGVLPTDLAVHVRGSLRIDTNGDNDVVSIDDATIHRNLSIDVGDGDDEVSLSATEVGSTSLNSNFGLFNGNGNGNGFGLGRFLGGLGGLRVRGDVDVDLGDGNDTLNMDEVDARGKIKVDAGDGDDEVSLGATGAGALNGSLGNLAFGNGNGFGNGFGFGRFLPIGRLLGQGGIHVDLGEGDDTLNLEDVNARGGVVVRGGEGDDTINVDTLTSTSLRIDGGDGMDTIMLDAVDALHATVNAGDDDDTVEIRDSVFTSLAVSLGDGDDTLTTAAVEAAFGSLLGGDGEDTFDLESENDIRFELIRGFEIPPDVNVPLLARRGLGNLFRGLRG